jgi:hypothetical protein
VPVSNPTFFAPELSLRSSAATMSFQIQQRTALFARVAAA